MSDPTDTTDEHDGPHEGPIKTPKQLILAVLFAFVVPVIAIILLVTYVITDHEPSAGSDGQSAQAVARRLQPVGQIEIKDLSDPASLKTGEQVYAAVCTACHTAGVAGAPKLGDAGAWAPRIATGHEALLNSALKGKGAMGPQGGGDYSDLEIDRAVVHMANQGGAKFEPLKTLVAAAAPASGAEPSAAATTTVTPATAAPAPAVAATPAAAAPPPAAAPAASVATAAAPAGAAPALYAQICQACHATSVAGSPKFGDKAAWAPRIAQGIDALTASVIKGKGAMPPKGGSSASDAEIRDVVAYMVNAAK
ncbi:MAG: c-type cytochrome [Burkholderiaceae bacterium]